MPSMSSLIKRLESTIARPRGESVLVTSKDIEEVVRILKSADERPPLAHNAPKLQTSIEHRDEMV
jgi:hypothetical protein